MKVDVFISALQDELGIDFYTGVPDSYLRAFCDSITDTYGVGDSHVIAENEGGAVGLAAGHYLATGHPALVYLQNSGLGNVVNPLCSLMHPYQIPALLLVGWRGEPGVKDEPQHIFQGQITVDLLKVIGIEHAILSPDVTPEEFTESILPRVQAAFAEGRQFAMVCRNNTFESTSKRVYANDYPMTRERAVELVSQSLPGQTAIISTTGKLSRELFEVREARGEKHESDFLIVGAMGHTSMIGTGVALGVPDRPVAIFDGDGSMLMHMGAVPILASLQPKNLKYFVFNNIAHESVGGMPTVAGSIDFAALAQASGFAAFYRATTEEELAGVLEQVSSEPVGPLFVEVCVNLKSRKDLGRPTETPIQCRDAFMAFVAGGQK